MNAVLKWQSLACRDIEQSEPVPMELERVDELRNSRASELN